MSTQQPVVAVYLADADRNGQPLMSARLIAAQRDVAYKSCELLGGCSIDAPKRGMWRNPDTGAIVEENTIRVWAYADKATIMQSMPTIYDTIMQYGRDFNQGEMMVEIHGNVERYTLPDTTSH